MRTLLSGLGLLGTLALAALAAPAGAQPLGSEFQVNTYTTAWQRTFPLGRRLVAGVSGNFVVVWEDMYQDGSDYGVFAQRYDDAGRTLGSEFRVNTVTTGSQVDPSVSSDVNGNFVVTWASDDQDGGGIFGQRYDKAGAARGSEFRINSFTTGYQARASVASDASGNFVVVWQGNGQDDSAGIFGQRFDSQGTPLGDEFKVNTYTTDAQFGPSVASDASGDFVVVWQGDGQDDSSGIFGQRYDSAGEALGTEFRINSYTQRVQEDPAVASDGSGNVVVVWRGSGAGDFSGIFSQRYDSAGVPQGDEFRVNTFTTSIQERPSVASDASGTFVVAWDSFSQDGSRDGIFGQRYDSDGIAQGGEFQINSYTPADQQLPSIGATGNDQFVVVWESRYQDGDGSGVFGQRFNFGPITVENPDTNVKWRIGTVQRIKWTHKLGLGATFRIELDRDDDGNYEELIAAAATVDSATKGSIGWTVTGPRSRTARVRVSWTEDLSVSDASDATFQIRPVGLDAQRE